MILVVFLTKLHFHTYLQKCQHVWIKISNQEAFVTMANAVTNISLLFSCISEVKKRHFKIKCNRAPLFFFLCRPKIFKFPVFFSILKLVNRQLASIYFAQNPKTKKPNLNMILIVVFVFKDYILFVFLIGALGMRATVS